MSENEPVGAGVWPFYDRSAVSVGPFARPSLELVRYIQRESPGPCEGRALLVRVQSWLFGALDAAGVELGTYDKQLVRYLAKHPDELQVIAGWIIRATCMHAPDDPAPTLPSIGNPYSPPYRRDAIDLGPFDTEPRDLYRIARYRKDGTDARTGEVASNSSAWMVAALDEAGVEIGEFDRYVAAYLAGEGWSYVQAAAGWVARAHRAGATPRPAERSEKDGTDD